MNNNVHALHPYSFAKMSQLLVNSTPSPAHTEIKLDISEPKHEPPSFMLDVLKENLDSIACYPTTIGSFELRQTIAHWLEKRFFLQHVNPNTEVLPVMSTRESIFSFVQAAINSSSSNNLSSSSNPSLLDSSSLNGETITSHQSKQDAIVIMPNSLYQIYECAANLAQATPYFIPYLPDNSFKADYLSVPKNIWEQTRLLLVCSPDNLTGKVMTIEDWELLIRLSDQYDFIIASDECYSELYFDEPPIGLLQACASLSRDDFKNCVVFHSLSKRSNLSGLRSGFIAGDADLLTPYLQYHTYQGFAMPLAEQLASIAAWQDEKHVVAHRALYQEKFALWMAELGEVLKLRRPEAGLYFWLKVPEQFDSDDEIFVKALYEQVHIYALAGSYLFREVDGHNPGKGYIRISLVISVEDTLEAIRRIRQLLKS